MVIHDMIQGTPEWWAVRAGVPTASNFSKIITPGGNLSASARKYAIELVEQRILAAKGVPIDIDKYMTREMQDGVDSEPEARNLYAFENGVDVTLVGFVTSSDGSTGCSPDGLVSEDGGLELKCPKLRTHLGYMLDGELPGTYKCQVHGCLAVTGREWWDFVSYVRGVPAFSIRVEPDGFTKKLAIAVQGFVELYRDITKEIEGRIGVIPAPKPVRTTGQDPMFM